MDIDKFKKLKSKLSFAFTIFLIFASNNFNLLAEEKILLNNTSKISIDYLSKIPESEYLLGSGDILEIVVSRFYPELTVIASVDGEGTIKVPKLNRIYVENLTLNELKDVLNKALKRYIKYPDVELEILRYRPLRVFVRGEVENPGMQVLEGSFSMNLEKLNKTNNIALNRPRTEMKNFFPTVFDGIRASGGITEYSDLSNVKIIRKNKITNGGGKITTTLDFEKVILEGDNSQNIRIYDEDIIIVNKSVEQNNYVLKRSVFSRLSPKFIDVFVTGRVKSPGKITVSKAFTLNDALSFVGGTKAIKGPVNFLRIKNDGELEKRKFNFNKRASRGSYKNPYLKNADLIYVGESLLSTTTEVLSEITSPITGIYSTYGLLKTITD